MRINKKNALRLWEMCFGDNNFAEDFHGYLMCREGYGDPDYYVCDGKERIYCGCLSDIICYTLHCFFKE